MPTTTLTDSTFSVSTIGARTDAVGTAVSDLSAEEARMALAIFNPGYLAPSTAFKVAAQGSPNMTVKIGSGAAKSDYYLVSGATAGQGNYLTRLDVTSQNVTIAAADVSQTRTDEIYLVIQDNVYDTSARSLPRIGYRRGDLGGANPGPDATWKASALLARVVVAAAVTSITNANITDLRTPSTLVSTLLGATPVLASLIDAKGDLIVGTANDTPARLAIGSDGAFLVADSSQASGVRWSLTTPNTAVNLTDAATVATNAALGNYFRLAAAGDRTLGAPTNPTDGQQVTWEILASGTDRTITLATGTAGSFLYGADLSSLSLTLSGKRDLLRAIYHAGLSRWLVVAYVKGF